MSSTRTPVRAEVDAAERVASVAAYRLLDADGGIPAVDTAESLRHLAELAAHMCDTSAGVVNVLDATHQHQVAAFGVDPRVCTVDDSMCATVLPDVATTMVPDASREPRFRDNPFVVGPFAAVRLYASAPLVDPHGFAIGTLCVFDSEPRVLSERQLRLLDLLAGQVVEVLELHRRTLALEDAGEELLRSNTMLSEFAGRVSHDLKSPLTSVLGFAETALKLTQDDRRVTRFLTHICAAARRMRDLIDEMLAFASVGGEPRLERVDVAETVREVQEDLHGLLTEAGARVTVQAGEVTADRHQLRMLLQNVVANSARYRSPDRPCRIAVSTSTTATGWRLQVADNGRGIPSEHAADVLVPLFRLPRDASVPGTGLGLSTCRRVAEAHGGSLSIEETPGGGATVILQVGAVGSGAGQDNGLRGR